jgi:hypothetical protein
LSGGAAGCGDSIGYNSDTDRVIFDLEPNYDDFFTRFSKAWDYEESKGNALKPWLDPIHSGSETLDGYYPTYNEAVRIPTGTHFRVFPNPAQDLFHIESQEPLQSNAYYTIINLSGIVIRRGMLNGQGGAEIQATAMAPGLYIISVGTSRALEHHKLLISGR